jgi:hypothetical protein
MAPTWIGKCQNDFSSLPISVIQLTASGADGFNGKIPIWNASISKQFMKYSRGEIKLSAFDPVKRKYRRHTYQQPELY